MSCSNHVGQPFPSMEHRKADSNCVRGKGQPKWDSKYPICAGWELCEAGRSS